MSNRDFGGLVRRSRERLGLSQTRLGELVGRAASTIRAWERGQSVPTDPTAVSSLAAVLGLDEGELFGMAGLDPPLVIEDHPTIEQSLREIAPREAPPPQEHPPVQESLLSPPSALEMADSAAPTVPTAPTGGLPGTHDDRPDETGPEQLPSLDAILASLDAPAGVPPEVAPAVATTAPTHDPGAPVGAEPLITDPAPHPDSDLTAGPAAAATIAGVVPAAAADPEVRRRDLRNGQARTPSFAPLVDGLRDLTVRWRNRPRRTRPPAPVGIASAPSYIEIPEEKVVYLRRRVYTAVAVFLALLLAIWSYGAARTALTETIDLLLSGL